LLVDCDTVTIDMYSGKVYLQVTHQQCVHDMYNILSCIIVRNLLNVYVYLYTFPGRKFLCTSHLNHTNEIRKTQRIHWMNYINSL